MSTSSSLNRAPSSPLLIIGAETIYSPMALTLFTESLMAILEFQGRDESVALVAAKKVYFGVGGSIEDFCDAVRARGGVVEQVREEVDGVRRAVVEVKMGGNMP
jgi:protein-histidine N-methyltransferase